MLADGAAVPLPLIPSSAFSPTSRPRAGRPRACSDDLRGLPQQPTGAVIEDDFFTRLVAFAARHGLVVVHDNAYADITYDGYVAPSFLETPGAKEVGVEMFSSRRATT